MQFNHHVAMTDFGFNTEAKAPGFQPNHEHMPFVPVKKSYFFRKELLSPFMSWLYVPAGDSCLLVGPTGSGKSSIVEQTCARLAWPCKTVSAHSRMEMPELTGYNLPYTDPVSGDLSTKFVDGPLTEAMRKGYVFVLDEYDTLDPAVSVGLHAVMEGRPLVIAENGGEVIFPHANFRFIACGNTAGQSDDSGVYAATMQQNLATLDRFRVFNVPYLTHDDEVSTIMDAVPDVPKELVENMVKIANSIRDQHMGIGGNYLSVTMSTRSLLRWARIAYGYTMSGQSNPLKAALAETLLNRCDKVQATAIDKIAQSVFGTSW